jgi:phosphoribosylaminoimidazolecarboxamide formyltransferase/IMP cyclohydrolase
MRTEGNTLSKKRALISVSDKTGIVELAQGLELLGMEIVSTGGTYSVLKDAGINVISVSSITGFAECLDGRLKTLHPHIHGGILAMRENPSHMNDLEKLGIEEIDIVVVNLYPFKQTVPSIDVPLEKAIEQIDIGGPSMLRAAAKNFNDVVILTDSADYMLILDELRENGSVSLDTKLKLSAKAFMMSADYDAAISNFLRCKADMEMFPQTLTLSYEKIQDLRYGENPHQKAALYREGSASPGSVVNAVQLHGKELSFNNINDTHGALELLREFDAPTVVACKHGNPCGVGSADTILRAWQKAYSADPLSIFGGIVLMNREVDSATASEISGIFVEVVLAPSFSQEALQILSKKSGIRLLKLKDIKENVPFGMDM